MKVRNRHQEYPPITRRCTLEEEGNQMVSIIINRIPVKAFHFDNIWLQAQNISMVISALTMSEICDAILMMTGKCNRDYDPDLSNNIHPFKVIHGELYIQHEVVRYLFLCYRNDLSDAYMMQILEVLKTNKLAS